MLVRQMCTMEALLLPFLSLSLPVTKYPRGDRTVAPSSPAQTNNDNYHRAVSASTSTFGGEFTLPLGPSIGLSRRTSCADSRPPLPSKYTHCISYESQRVESSHTTYETPYLNRAAKVSQLYFHSLRMPDQQQVRTLYVTMDNALVV